MTKQAGAKIVTKKAEKSEKLEKHAGKKAAAKEAHEDGAAGKPKKASGAKKAGKHGAAAPLPVTPELRRHMISEMAYYRAESRGFSGGSAHDDWVAAEAVIDRMFSDTLE